MFICHMYHFVLKPATGRPCVLALVDSGTVPAFTCDYLRCVCAFTRRRKFDLCVPASSRTMLAFEKKTSVARVEHVLLLRFVAGNVDVNTLASKRFVLIGNEEIVRKRRIIHNKSTCLCVRLPVAAITQKHRDASFDM